MGLRHVSRQSFNQRETMMTKALIFSALANDMPDGTDSQATAAVDRALVAIAEAL